MLSGVAGGSLRVHRGRPPVLRLDGGEVAERGAAAASHQLRGAGVHAGDQQRGVGPSQVAEAEEARMAREVRLHAGERAQRADEADAQSHRFYLLFSFDCFGECYVFAFVAVLLIRK